MKTLKIHGASGPSIIMVGERLQNLKKYIPIPNAMIITDSNVGRIYQKDFPPLAVITIGMGEQIKTLDTVRYVYEQLLALEADRSSFIVGIGGGIVCDIAGFVASTFLRGVRFGFVSTTLLSQVDASVGGKNGVNFGGYKNMVGVIHQPEFVVCDTRLLHTLPLREILCGLAEIVKHAVIGDAELFDYLEKNYQKALALDNHVIDKLVFDSMVIKSAIVNQDEKEKGERRKLNFGHTFGHAFEKTIGVPHGEAVAAGMVIAARLSVKKGCLAAQDAQRIEALVLKFKLPSRLHADATAVMNALRRDKKRQGDSIHFVLLDQIGRAIVEQISISELETAINELGI